MKIDADLNFSLHSSARHTPLDMMGSQLRAPLHPLNIIVP